MNWTRISWVLSLALCTGAWVHAIDDFNVDSLVRNPIKLPNGGQIVNVVYKERNWRETTVDELKVPRVLKADDICFEAKFEGLEGKELQLFQQDGRVVSALELTFLKRLCEKLKRGDNIWICGTLRQSTEIQGVELLMYELKKLPDDIPRSEAMLNRYTKDKTTSAEQYLELGNKMDKLQKSNIYNNQQVEKLVTLRNQCWTAALEMKEATIAADDANAFFLLSQQWDDLLHKTNKRRDLLRKALQIDPDHPGASKVARDLNLVKDKKSGRWITRDEYEKQIADDNKRKKDSEALDEQAKLARIKLREKAIIERPRELARFQSALKTDDIKAQEGALESLSEAVQNSLDPVFARQGVQILAQSPSLGTAVRGLSMALKNEAPEVRQDAFEALIWRGGPEAFKSVQTALLAEANTDTARATVGALVSRADKEAAGVLVESLESQQPGVVMEAVAGLRAISGTNQPGKDAWVKWWSQNKDKPDLKLSAPE